MIGQCKPTEKDYLGKKPLAVQTKQWAAAGLWSIFEIDEADGTLCVYECQHAHGEKCQTKNCSKNK